ncbi:MAG: flavin reductase family protein [Methanobacteriales archaeon]|nr:flavin reductase family protein [Methanobacteriales archaeon]
MELELSQFYRVMAPRTTIIVTTVNRKGEINAAPFSFTMPVSVNPPLLALASVPTHHTYHNLQETGEFVVNLPGEGILDQLWITSESFPAGVNELEKAHLTPKESLIVKAPGIKECTAQLECKVVMDLDCGDHQLVVGEVVRATALEESLLEGLLDVEKTKPLLHLGGKDFVVGDHRKRVE